MNTKQGVQKAKLRLPLITKIQHRVKEPLKGHFKRYVINPKPLSTTKANKDQSKVHVYQCPYLETIKNIEQCD